jgi:hypothetical protein
MTNLNALWQNGLWRMAGTEGTGEYTVRAASIRGRVGIRHLGAGRVRIRLEPASISDGIMARWQKELSRDIGYKQPGEQEQERFSIVVSAGVHADEILKIMFGLLGEGKLKGFILNPDMLNPTTTTDPIVA